MLFKKVVSAILAASIFSQSVLAAPGSRKFSSSQRRSGESACMIRALYLNANQCVSDKTSSTDLDANIEKFLDSDALDQEGVHHSLVVLYMAARLPEDKLGPLARAIVSEKKSFPGLVKDWRKTYLPETSRLVELSSGRSYPAISGQEIILREAKEAVAREIFEARELVVQCANKADRLTSIGLVLALTFPFIVIYNIYHYCYQEQCQFGLCSSPYVFAYLSLPLFPLIGTCFVMEDHADLISAYEEKKAQARERISLMMQPEELERQARELKRQAKAAEDEFIQLQNQILETAQKETWELRLFRDPELSGIIKSIDMRSLAVPCFEDQEGECTICWEDLAKGRVFVFNCDHGYHAKCLQEMAQNGMFECPVCKKPS